MADVPSNVDPATKSFLGKEMYLVVTRPVRSPEIAKRLGDHLAHQIELEKRGIMFAAATGIKILHVPFRGDSAAVTGLLGKTVDAIVTPGTVVFGNIQGGNFRALAITSSERWPALKDVPTVAETVSPGFEMIA